MSDEPVEPAESDMRRRAAWLLGMLVLVAALVVVLMVTLLGSSDGGNKNSIADIDPPSSSAPPSASATTARSSSTPVAPSTSEASTSVASTTSAAKPKCPSAATCVLPGDVGNAVAAINAYRTRHHLSAVPGAVTPAAQKCAKNGGNGCTGGWAETQLGKADGTLAVKQILKFGRLLDPNMKSIGVGWAYDPGQRQYNFALIRSG